MHTNAHTENSTTCANVIRSDRLTSENAPSNDGETSSKAQLDAFLPIHADYQTHHEFLHRSPDTWVSAVGISSLNGGAALDGVSGNLGNAFDQQVLHRARHRADFIVVGAETVRAEGYEFEPITEPEVLALRRSLGQTDTPRFAIPSRSLQLTNPESIVGADDQPTIILTTAPRKPSTPHQAPQITTDEARSWQDNYDHLASLGFEILVLDDVTPPTIINSLRELTPASRNGCHISVEGGPSWYSRFIAASCVDELLLTLAPVITDNETPLISLSESGADPQWSSQWSSQWCRLVSTTISDSHLFLRYFLDSRR